MAAGIAGARRRSMISAVAASLIATAGPAAADALQTYRVAGVPAGDALTVRDEPDRGRNPSQWKALGTLPPHKAPVLATGRSKLIGSQRWAEIVFDSGHGWVNAKFLREESRPLETLSRETVNCFGTEPFWGLTLGDAKSEYSDSSGEKHELVTQRVQRPAGLTFPLLYRLADAKGRTIEAIVGEQTWCSDNMSNYDYALHAHLLEGDTFLSGCCMLRR